MISRSQAVAKLLFIDLVGSVVWFPVWWYTIGLRKVVDAALRAIRYRVQSYALRIWIRNFFVPMYGQYDWTGRLVSILMRFMVLIGRCVALIVEALAYCVGVIAWGVAPLGFALMIFMNVVQAMRG